MPIMKPSTIKSTIRSSHSTTDAPAVPIPSTTMYLKSCLSYAYVYAIVIHLFAFYCIITIVALHLLEEVGHLDEDTNDEAKDDQQDNQVKPLNHGRTGGTHTVNDDVLKIFFTIVVAHIGHFISPSLFYLYFPKILQDFTPDGAVATANFLPLRDTGLYVDVVNDFLALRS